VSSLPSLLAVILPSLLQHADLDCCDDVVKMCRAQKSQVRVVMQLQPHSKSPVVSITGTARQLPVQKTLYRQSPEGPCEHHQTASTAQACGSATVTDE
jgi:hypothetical protein